MRAFPYIVAALAIAVAMWATMGAPLPTHPDGGLAQNVRASLMPPAAPRGAAFWGRVGPDLTFGADISLTSDFRCRVE